MKFTGERFIPDSGLESEIELEHLQRYLSVQDVVAEKVVLDVASGAGYGTSLLAEKAFFACGIDISREAVAFAREHYQSLKLAYGQGSLVALPFPDDSFDVVVSFETIEHVPEDLHEEFLKEILRVLRPDGLLLISTPDKHIYSELPGYHNEFHIKEYYRQEFSDFLKQFFPNICLLDQFQELAYTLTDNKADSCRILRCDSSDIAGKYIIAMCGQGEIPDIGKIGSVIFDTEGRYQAKVDRVVELQGEIVEKNRNIADCWDLIHERDDIIEQMAHAQKQHKKTIETLKEQKNVGSTKSSEKDSEIVRLRNDVDEMRQKNNELAAILSHIHSTKAWKIIQKIYWLKEEIW